MDLGPLRALIGRAARGGTRHITENSVISAVDRTGPPEFSTTGTMLVLMVQGAKRLAVGDRVHEYRAGQTLLTPADLPTTGHFIEATRDAPALGFALTLSPALVAGLLLDPAAARLSSSRTTAAAPPGVIVDRAPDDLVEAVTRMVGLLDRPRDLPVLAPLVEREIVWLLLRGRHGAAVRQLGLADSRLNRVSRAIRVLRAHYAEPLRVEDLARQASMSVSAFHRAFHAVTAMSPIQFQKQLRLQEARVRLLADHSDVAGVAHAVGYGSASQFSRDYRRRFGAPPTRDVARLHAAVVP